MDAQNTESWLEASATGAITIEELDQLVVQYKVARDEYDVAKQQSDSLYKSAEEAKRKVLEAMRQSGKQKYHVDGVGLCYLKNDMVVPTPKTPQDKQALFAYIEAQYGKAFLMEKLAIHHATLQKLYNESYKEAVEAGKGDTFHMPGLDQPTTYQSLAFRKE